MLLLQTEQTFCLAGVFFLFLFSTLVRTLVSKAYEFYHFNPAIHNKLYKGHTSSYLSQYMHYFHYHLELLVILL